MQNIPNEIREDMLKIKRMVSEVEMIIGKQEGETELVNKLIDAENLLTYCMSRLENAIVPPCKVGDTVYMPWEWNGTKGVAILTVTHIITDCLHSYVKAPLYSDDEEYSCKYSNGRFSFDDFGKIVFLTREEAERALEEKL